MRQVGSIFAHNVFWTTTASLSQGILAFLLIAVFVKLGGEDKYGLWTLIISTSSIIGVMTTLRLSDSMVRFLSGEDNVRRKEQGFFTILLVVFVLSAFVSILFANWDWFFDRFFSTTSDVAAARIGLFLIIAYALEWIVLDSYRTFDRFRAYAINIILRSWLLLLTVLILLALNTPFLYLILGVLILRFGIVIAAIANIAWAEQMSIKRWLRQLNFNLLPGYLSYSIPMLCAGISGLVLSSSDRLVVSYFENVSAVGTYSAAYTVGSLGTFVIGPLQLTLYPALSRFWNAQNYGKAEAYAKLALEYFFLLAVPLTIWVALLADIILSFLASTSVSQAGWQVASVVAVGTFFYGIHSIALLIITLSKRVWTIAIIVTTFAILNVLLNTMFLGVSNMGIVGAALATLIAFLLMALSSSIVAYRYLSIKINGVLVLKIALAGFAMAFMMYTLQHTSAWARILGGVMGGFTYFLCLALTRAISLSDLKMLWTSSPLKILLKP